LKNSYPVLAVRDIVMFPHVVVPLFVGRAQSVKAIEAAMKLDKKVVFLTQKKTIRQPTISKNRFRKKLLKKESPNL
jgi:ATP-dependent Lon protease